LDDRGVPDAVCSISTDITDRRIAEIKLEASLKEKELLLQEIHHRVKNNLQVVASLLNLQQRTIKDPAVAQLFEDSRNRVYTMAAVHEKLYQSKSLDRINLGDYLRDLIDGLIQSYNVNSNYIQFEINTDLINVNIETAIPCGLIVNELVTNIVKHAFPDRRQGKVLVECLATSDGSIQLKVCDNGVGIPAHIDLSRASSLGLRIIGQLSRQLKGKMKIEATEGTCFALKFAELKYRNRI
jgi:two-component sensor histidine kinase